MVTTTCSTADVHVCLVVVGVVVIVTRARMSSGCTIFEHCSGQEKERARPTIEV